MQMILLSDSGGWHVNASSRVIGTALAALIAMMAAAVYVGHAMALAERAPLRSDQRFARDVLLLTERHQIDRALAEADRALVELTVRAAQADARLDVMEASHAALARVAGVRSTAATSPGIDLPTARDPNGAVVRFGRALAALEAAADRLDAQAPRLDELQRALVMARVERSTEPRGRPIRKGWISSSFGWRTDPLTGRRAFHDGLDLAGKYRSPVLAVADGVVAEAGTRRGYGNIVEIRHRHGLATRYAHNAKNLVTVGERVQRGDVIALMGSTGRSTGAHVHFEVIKDGQRVNPRPFTRSE